MMSFHVFIPSVKFVVMVKVRVTKAFPSLILFHTRHYDNIAYFASIQNVEQEVANIIFSPNTHPSPIG